MPHIHEAIDFAVDVLIVQNNKVLLRMHDKYGIWLCPGGHIELGEDPNQAAIREVKEETGLEIRLWPAQPASNGKEKELVPPRFLNRHQITETHDHVSLVFLAQALTTKLEPVVNESSPGLRWFSIDDLNNSDFRLTPRIAYYAKKALQELSQTC